MARFGVHNKVENHGQEVVALRHSVEPLERGGMVPSRLFHHVNLAPVLPENPYFPEYHALSFHYFQALVPVQGIVCLMGEQEDFIYYCIPHFCQLLNQLGFKRGDPCPLA